MDKETKIKEAEMRAEARMRIIEVASVGIAGAIILACYAYTRVDGSLLQTVLYVFASLISTISGLFIAGAVIIGRAEKNRHNFFLYDRKKKADIPVSALTIKEIRERLLQFIAIFKKRGKLYIGELFDENPNIPEQFKPLFCYEFLYEIAIDDGMDATAFLKFGDECAEIFAKYLRENDDHELASNLKKFISDFSKENNNSEKFKDYIKAHKEHIENKMLGYTVKNIEKF